MNSVIQSVAEKSIEEVAECLKGDQENTNVAISVDETWQRKGFTSTLVVVTAISVDTGKVVDCVILSKRCKGCTKMNGKSTTDPAAYNLWKLEHRCNLN